MCVIFNTAPLNAPVMNYFKYVSIGTEFNLHLHQEQSQSTWEGALCLILNLNSLLLANIKYELDEAQDPNNYEARGICILNQISEVVMNGMNGKFS